MLTQYFSVQFLSAQHQGTVVLESPRRTASMVLYLAGNSRFSTRACKRPTTFVPALTQGRGTLEGLAGDPNLV
jgi:hypothetical protein